MLDVKSGETYFISTLKLEKFSKFVNTEIKRVRIEFLIQTQVKTSLFPPLIINFANRLPKETNIKKDRNLLFWTSVTSNIENVSTFELESCEFPEIPNGVLMKSG